jgi:hypothetical protein
MDKQHISCFATPSISEFEAIQVKVHDYLTAGGLESRLPHANQLWMFVGFALFRRLRVEWECLEVYPQATMRILGASSIPKGKAGGVSAQLEAVSRYTGWPQSAVPHHLEALRGAVRAPSHDAVDAYASAWVASLDSRKRRAFGSPPNDVI